MCGIAGIALSTAEGAADIEGRLATMAAAMRHRGPDDGGVKVVMDGQVGLANRRLAVRDLSLAGHMPMASQDGRVWITYNGEIYNHQALTRQLADAGCSLHSRSDTEVILRGYETWGGQVVEMLRGEFALAIVDLRGEMGAGKLLLARDRLGVKPLYVARSRRGFAFASECRSLLGSGMVNSDIDPAGAAGFLLWGSVASHTTYDGVESLRPGSTLEMDLSHLDREPVQRVYWTIPTTHDDRISRAEAVQRISAAVDDSVRVRLVSDVPLGVFLSGGLDSSGVAAVMRQASSGTIRSCSIAFPGEEGDEGSWARLVADELGLEHHEHVVTADEVREDLDAVLASLDLPSIDGVNTFFVSKAARSAGLTVALSGLGGDELFGGYPQTFDWVPRTLAALRASRRLPGFRTVVPAALGLAVPQRASRLADVMRTGRASRADAYYACRGLFSPSEVRALMTPGAWADVAGGTSIPLFRGQPELTEDGSLPAWVSRAELAIYMHNQLLRDTDTMSMTHSLEVRVPLIDHVLVEEVAVIAPRVRFAGGPKSLLVDALRDKLPASVLERPKQGFTFPFARWFRDELQDVVRDRVLSVPPGGMLQQREAEGVWKQYLEGRTHWSRPWAIAVLNHFVAR